ncbi:MAG TPA: tryptophan synthase subunit beta [Gammaproteobacteria bacterium]|nr:tryptophan synthase subunit beta [Gammaproteobacteria bacterium]
MNTRFGQFGGLYVPQILVPALKELEEAFLCAQKDSEFQRELKQLLEDFLGRPTPLYECRTQFRQNDVRLFLKREDLVHGGAHKTNQALGQALLAKKMGKTRLIAETGAGQHGVATAIVGALMGFETCIYMGKKDAESQASNVARMEAFGATLIRVEQGSQTLKEAVNAALRDWSESYQTTHYLIGSCVGPHPFPTMVQHFQKVIGEESRDQILSKIGTLPDKIIACVGGGSNAIGIFTAFLDDPSVELIGVEALGRGLESGLHGAVIQAGKVGILHGAKTKVLQTQEGQIACTHSIASGLDYPGIGPVHAHLSEIKRAQYVGVTDDDAIEAFHWLAQNEGILAAIESCHALAYALQRVDTATSGEVLLVNLSGRGDKDLSKVTQIK